MSDEIDQEAADHAAMLAEMEKRKVEEAKIAAVQDAALEKVRAECAAARAGQQIDEE
jgi:hypothetical protein